MNMREKIIEALRDTIDDGYEDRVADRILSHIDALKADLVTARTSALKEAAEVANKHAARFKRYQVDERDADRRDLYFRMQDLAESTASQILALSQK